MNRRNSGTPKAGYNHGYADELFKTARWGARLPAAERIPRRARGAES